MVEDRHWRCGESREEGWEVGLAREWNGLREWELVGVGCGRMADLGTFSERNLSVKQTETSEKNTN